MLFEAFDVLELVRSNPECLYCMYVQTRLKCGDSVAGTLAFHLNGSRAGLLPTEVC